MVYHGTPALGKDVSNHSSSYKNYCIESERGHNHNETQIERQKTRNRGTHAHALNKVRSAVKEGVSR